MRHYRRSLTFSILAALSALLILTWLLLSIIAFTTAEQDIYALKSEQARVMITTLRKAIRLPLDLQTQNQPIFSVFTDSLTEVEGFAGLLIVDSNGRTAYSLADRSGVDSLLQETLRTGVESSHRTDVENEFRLYSPLTLHGKTAGAVRLSLNLAREKGRLANSRRMLQAYFILDFLVLLVFGYVLLKRIVVEPMRKLLHATDRIASGDYSHNVNVPGSAEIAELADSYNTMLRALRNKQEEVARHVHSLEEVNRQLKDAREESIRSERLASVGLLAAGTAHEIGTPLAAVIGYAGILKEELANKPDNQDYACRIEQEAGRIDRIVRDLLNYAAPSHGKPEKIEVGPVIEETVALLTGQGVFRNIVTELILEDDIPEIRLDRSQFQQVLINLLINARDAMPQGGSIEARVSLGEFSAEPADRKFGKTVRGRRREDFGGAFVSSCESERCVRIDIRDTGEGILLENLERVFDPFFSTKEPGRGTGLGLSISARIIDSFGGRITVSSDPGLGTCFSIWFPIKED